MYNNFRIRKSSISHQAKRRKEENLSPRNMKACHSINIAPLQSVTEIGTQSTMKSSMNVA
jgi:hypothetical protein